MSGNNAPESWSVYTCYPRSFDERVASGAGEQESLRSWRTTRTRTRFVAPSCLARHGVMHRRFITDKATGVSETLANCPKFNQKWLTLYVKFWRHNGLLPANNHILVTPEEKEEGITLCDSKKDFLAAPKGERDPCIRKHFFLQ